MNDPNFLSREYNNRVLVKDHPQYFARWAEASARARSTMICYLDRPYGDSPGEKIDIFPARKGDGSCMMFIHGGYWRSLDKSMFSWLAASYVPEGLNVALVNYRLCPAVRIDDIVQDVVGSMNWLMGPYGPAKDGKVVVAGHSAGGHLVGAIFATPTSATSSSSTGSPAASR